MRIDKLKITVLSVELGFSPLDQQLELWEKNWSEGLAKEAVWLSGAAPSFELAEETFRRIGQVAMSGSTIWRRVNRWGEKFRMKEKEAQEVANRSAQIGEVIAPKNKSTARMGVGMDGAMIHIRQEGWKELKVGCVFDIDVRPNFDKESQVWLEQGHALNNSYLAHLGGPEEFGEMMWAAAKQRGWSNVMIPKPLGDGAPGFEI